MMSGLLTDIMENAFKARPFLAAFDLPPSIWPWSQRINGGVDFETVVRFLRTRVLTSCNYFLMNVVLFCFRRVCFYGGLVE